MKKLKKYIVLVSMLLCVSVAQAQENQTDTCAVNVSDSTEVEDWNCRLHLKTNVVGLGMAIVNAAVDKYDVMGVHGNGTNVIVLKEAHADKADILISVASTDEINMLTCTIAQKIGVKYTLARIRNPENIEQIKAYIKDCKDKYGEMVARG